MLTDRFFNGLSLYSNLTHTLYSDLFNDEILSTPTNVVQQNGHVFLFYYTLQKHQKSFCREGATFICWLNKIYIKDF